MIRLIEIDKLAKFYKVSAETIEKDYMISWILYCISKSSISNNFIFYGGTAIKRMYFEDHRSSEDIDLLSANKFSLNEIMKMMQCLEHAKKTANLSLEVNPTNITVINSRILLYVKYQGYEEIVGAPKEILIDFNMDVELFGKSRENKMIESYSDLKYCDVMLQVMSLNTIFANKLGMLLDLSRNEPRDIFDIWFILQRVNKFDFDLKEVRDAFKKKYGFNLKSNIIIPVFKNNVQLKNNWKNRLSNQIAELPDYDFVTTEISNKLNMIFPE